MKFIYMKLPNMTKVVSLLMQGMMFSIVWWKWRCHHFFMDYLFTTYAAANYLVEWGTFMTGTIDKNSWSICLMKSLLLSWRLVKKCTIRRRDALPCHIGKSNHKTSLSLCYHHFMENLMFCKEKRLTKRFWQ